MNAAELRIGNWVIINNGEKAPYNWEVSAHDIEEIDGYGEDTFGIQLSPEILEKCGFEYEHDQTGMQFKCGSVYMYYDNEGSLSANFGHIEQLDVSVGFVHKLQNLYYALTGKELEINL